MSISNSNLFFRFFSDEEVKTVCSYFWNIIEGGLKAPTMNQCKKFMQDSGLLHVDWHKVKDVVKYRSQKTIKTFQKQLAAKKK
jgi:hypothetical protein